jgi:hypothetical protein
VVEKVGIESVKVCFTRVKKPKAGYRICIADVCHKYFGGFSHRNECANGQHFLVKISVHIQQDGPYTASTLVSKPEMSSCSKEK